MRGLVLILILVPFLIGANLGLVDGGGVGNVTVRGDSLSSEDAPNGCNWCDPVVASGLQVFNLAHGGARSYFSVEVGEEAFNWCQSPTYTDCDNFGVYQAHYFDGECRRTNAPRWPGDVAGTSCAEDMPVSGQYVDVYFFGVNDVWVDSVAYWDSTRQAIAEASFRSLMNTSATEGNACVVVLGPPAFSQFQFDDPLNTDVKLVKLHDWIKVEVPANWPHCTIADTYSIFRDVETEYGSDAMLDMYVDPNCGTWPPTTGESCIHPADGPIATAGGIRPNDAMGEVILESIRAARHLRRKAPNTETENSCIFPATMPCTF